MESVPGGFWEWMASLDGAERPLLIFLCLIATIVTISIVATVVYKIHKSRLDDALKRELLERGMGADEIARIVEARSGAKSTDCGTQREV